MDHVYLLIGGIIFIIFGLRQLFFFFKGGGLTWNPWKYESHPSRPKAPATSEEQFYLIGQAVITLAIGIVLMYEGIFGLF
jgi:hypothetical protein